MTFGKQLRRWKTWYQSLSPQKNLIIKSANENNSDYSQAKHTQDWGNQTVIF